MSLPNLGQTLRWYGLPPSCSTEEEPEAQRIAHGIGEAKGAVAPCRGGVARKLPSAAPRRAAVEVRLRMDHIVVDVARCC